MNQDVEMWATAMKDKDLIPIVEERGSTEIIGWIDMNCLMCSGKTLLVNFFDEYCYLEESE